ncbi:MAG: hypothetical protein HYX32_00165 [Actinobacteria bacterium]|nr:hypothetical protein [Actinomycetota bacterium]
MTDDATNEHERPHGFNLLPRDLTEEELDAAPVLKSLDDLVIEDLTDEEYEAFLTALGL